MLAGLLAADEQPSTWFELAITLAPLPLLVYLLWRLHTLIYPMFQIARGEYAQARRGFERTTHFWIPSAARASRYNVALCLELEGRLDEAETAVRALLGERLDARLTYAARSLLGTILVLRETHPEEARALLVDAQREVPTRLGTLILAHAHLALGDRGGAARLISDALTMPTAPPARVGWKASLRFDTRVQSSMEAFFRGWYFYKVGEMARARSDLRVAAQSPLAHVCTQRARALLPAASRPSFGDEAASSLSPHELP